ncbi:MAG: glycine zipper 2TM domain-containing protein [Burkholderiales bacterium]|nr:glycine zipper 2TM domain-containing protein [Burkholderiales bacterium]
MKEMSMSDNNTPASSNAPRTALITGGGIALVGLGLAAGMFLRSPSAPADKAADPAVAAASAASAAALNASAVAEGAIAPATGAQHHESAKAARRHEAARHTTETAQGAQPGQPQAAPVCDYCGTVDSVRAVQQEGQGSGVGAVAGGVLGGVVGNQMGKGSGKTALTILGAIGGGVAGNEIEKHQKAETVYDVTVRMDDGSMRTFKQKTAPATGSRVEVDGQTLRALTR